MIENQIFKIFLEDKSLFVKYYSTLNLKFLRENYPNISKLFTVLDTLYKEHEYADRNLFEVKYYSSYPVLKDSERKELNRLLDSIFELENINKEAIVKLLEEHRRRSLAGDVAKLAIDVEDGKAQVQELLDLFSKFEHQEVEVDVAKPVDMNLKDLYDSQVATPGLRWRLDCLNKSLGSLRKGDFGFIFARPETGKTTFLASEITNMVSQSDGEILWFNNEEQGNKVAIRCFQAALGLPTEFLFDNLERRQREYDQVTNNKIKIFEFEDSNRVARIESILKTHNPSLIIFDQIDKIKGFKGERNDLELKALYQWARELAKTYAPVIAVSQASGEAEGKLWLSMDLVDGSKTAKQGEADWILGIGKDSDNTSRSRYFSICKNKLLGDEDTLPELRHGQMQVIIKPEIARYEDI